MTFTTLIGHFVFSEKADLAKAKLIRDTVVGQILNPKDGRMLKSGQNVLEYIQATFDRDAWMFEGINFR